MRYMLDTNTLVYVLNARPQHQAVLDRFNEHDPRQLCLSAVTLAELRFGVAQSQRREATQAKLDRVIDALNVVPFEDRAARIYGTLRAQLQASGQWTIRSSKRFTRSAPGWPKCTAMICTRLPNTPGPRNSATQRESSRIRPDDRQDGHRRLRLLRSHSFEPRDHTQIDRLVGTPDGVTAEPRCRTARAKGSPARPCAPIATLRASARGRA